MDQKYFDHKQMYFTHLDKEFTNFQVPDSCEGCGTKREQFVIYRPYGIAFCTNCNKPSLPAFPQI
jgi:hypothetical protein